MHIDDPIDAFGPSLRMFLETIPLSIWIYRLDGLLVAMSRYGEQFWGIKRTELIGKYNMLEVTASVETGSHEFFARALKGEVFQTEPALYDTSKMDVVDTRSMKVWLQRTVFPLYDALGNISHVVLIHRNVTEYIEMNREAAEALRESEERFHAFMDYSPATAAMKDITGKYVYVSKAWLRQFNWQANDVLGKTVDELFPPDVAAQLRDHDRDVLQTGKVNNTVEILPRADGISEAILVYRFPLQDSSGRRFVCGVGIDITERVRAEAALRQARDELELRVQERTKELERANEQLQRELTERVRIEAERLALERKLLETQKLESLGVLAGGIAHDFNNLLAVILGNAGLALMELAPGSPSRESIMLIELAAQRAADLTRQMLAYAGKGVVVVQRLNLNAIVTEMTHLLDVSIAKNVVLHYQLAPDLPAIEADTAQMRQIVMNLVINAAEAIGSHSGVVTLSTGSLWADHAYLQATHLAAQLSEGCYVYLEVSDTGSGMDAATQAKIFDPFFTTKFTGRGLGLAAVLGIVRRHQGAVKVSSEPGAGTIMTCLFPASELAADEAAVVASMADEWRGSGTILVVDDDPDVRAVAARMLGQFGFTVLTAEDGRSGVELFRAHTGTISCVLLDLTMPHLSGEDAFRAIRRIDPQAHVLLMSGYSEEDVASRFAGKGLTGFVHKPFTPTELRAKLRQVLG